MTQSPQSQVRRGRWCLVMAAVLWSLSGLGTRLLQRPSFLELNEPALTPLQIAFLRAVFAGLVLFPLVPFRQIGFRPLMPAMIVCFAAMNALFISAIALGSAANAILLQNTAPFFVVAISFFVFRERVDRRSLIAIIIGLIGMAIIVGGDGKLLNGERIDVALMGLGSGITYAFIILCLRALRDQPSAWLISQNHLGSAICLCTAVLVLNGPSVWWQWLRTPTMNQLIFMSLFGALQMGLPYFLFARGLRSVSPQEAGAITLLEPLLNPVWAYLISPETDTPTIATWLGGSFILGALAYRYWPTADTTSVDSQSSDTIPSKPATPTQM